jgi:hypothetical protein
VNVDHPLEKNNNNKKLNKSTKNIFNNKGRYVEVGATGVEAGLPIASRYFRHCHAEISASYQQLGLTSTSACHP